MALLVSISLWGCLLYTSKVNKFDEEFPDLKNVAAICVYPNFAEVVKDTLEVGYTQMAATFFRRCV